MTAQLAAVPDRLVRALESYAADESHDVEECQALADEIADPISCFLLRLVVLGGTRNTNLVRAMIERLQSPIGPDPSCIPEMVAEPSTAEGDATAARVRAIVRDEHESARHVRHVARQEPAFYDGLYPILLETIARDAEKHATMLQFILRRVQERPE